MKNLALSSLDVENLVNRFAEIGVAQDWAILGGQTKQFKKLFDQMIAVINELKSRPGDQRIALLQLYVYPNIQVRLEAAKATLAVTPNEARQQMELIANMNWLPQSGDAGMSLINLDRGIFKPT